MEAPEMVPLEEAVEALIDGLVSPFLPRRSDTNAPTLEQQELVAKQMYAVVVLYNYYHRKLFPKLDFLDFKSFCKVSCISKPSLLKYMKSIYKGDARSGDIKENLSITERMIMDACNVSSALDASKDAPGMAGWPISKVAVFLVDRSMEYCLLRSNGRTQAIMPVIEMDLVTPVENVFCAMKTKYMLGSKINPPSLSLQDKFNSVEDILQEVAFSTVEKEMGIRCSNLSILGSHLSYSLSHMKSCTRLYIMSYTGPIDNQIPVKEVMQSLQGPLVKINSGVPEVTPVIQYYNLLPYVDILSDFLFREFPRSTFQPNLKLKADFAKEGAGRILVNGSNASHELVNNCCIKTTMTNGNICKNEVKPPVRDLFASSQNAAIGSLTEEVLPAAKEEGKQDDLPALKQKSDIMIRKKRKVKSILAGSSEAAHHYKAVDSSIDHKFKSSIRDRETKLQNAISHNSVDNVKNGVDKDGESMNEMIVKLNCHDPLAISKKVDAVSVLKMLKEKRNELCQQQRLLEDNISHCEMSILTIVSGNETSAPEIESMLSTCDIRCSNEMKDLNLSIETQCQPRTISRKRLHEAVLSLQSPCQELDEIVCTNNWILPKYYVLPSVDGKFQALVSVRGIDFESEISGDWKDSPREARESSATHMLSKLRSMATQPQ